MLNKKYTASKISTSFMILSAIIILLCITKFFIKSGIFIQSNNVVNEIQILFQKIIPFGKVYFLVSASVFLFSLAFFFDSKLRFSENEQREFSLNRTKYFYFMVITVFSILSLLAISIISWPSADDYLIYKQVKDFSLIGYSSFYYFNWDGRYFTYLLQSILFHLFGPNNSYLIVLINSLSFILLSYLIGHFVNTLDDSNILNKHRYYAFIINIPLLFLSLFPILREVVYWATGGIYIIDIVIIILWIYLMYILLFKNLKLKYKYLSIPFIAIFSFFIGGTSQNVSLGLIFLIIIFIIISRRYRSNKINGIAAIVSLIFLIIGSILMYIAPGNYMRGEIFSNKFNLSIFEILKNYFLVLKNYSNVTFRIIIFSAISAIFTAVAGFDYQKAKFFSIKKYLESHKNNILIYVLFLVSALISIIPFILVPDVAVPRSGIYFYIFIFIFIWGIAYNLFCLLLIFFSKKYFKPRLASFIFVLIVFTGLSYNLIQTSYNEIIYDLPIKKQMIERNYYLKEVGLKEKNKDIAVKPITLPVFGKDPKMIHFFEIKEDKDFRVNIWVAEYFNLNSIKISK